MNQIQSVLEMNQQLGPNPLVKKKKISLLLYVYPSRKLKGHSISHRYFYKIITALFDKTLNLL